MYFFPEPMTVLFRLNFSQLLLISLFLTKHLGVLVAMRCTSEYHRCVLAYNVLIFIFLFQVMPRKLILDLEYLGEKEKFLLPSR